METNSTKNMIVAAGILAVVGTIYFVSKPRFYVAVDNSKKQITVKFNGVTEQYNWPQPSGFDFIQSGDYSLHIEDLSIPGFHIRMVKYGTKIIEEKSIKF